MKEILLFGLVLAPLAGAAVSSRSWSNFAAVASLLLIPALLLLVLEIVWLVDRSSIGCFEDSPTCSQGDSVLFFAVTFYGLFFAFEFIAGITVGGLIRGKLRRTKGIV